MNQHFCLRKFLQNRFVRGLFLIILGLNSLPGRSQYSDFWSWNLITFAGKISPSWDIRLSEEFRYDEPFGHLAKYFTQLELLYSPVKFLAFEGAYRNIRDHQNDGSWEKQHRLNFSAEVDKRFGRLTPSYRLRWQNYPGAWNTSKTGYFYLRHKLNLKWDIPDCKINPEFSTELFHRFNNDGTREIAMLRFSVKSTYKFNKRNRISFGLHKQYEYDEKTPENAWILRLGYRFDLF